MADSFFGFDASVSNVNDDDGGGGDGSEDEYDALNDETFGQADVYDWESQHEHLAEQLESSRRSKNDCDDTNSHSQLEASLSQLVLDEPPRSSALGGSHVWQHDAPFGYTPPKQPKLKNLLSVEELERQLRQPHQQQQQQMQLQQHQQQQHQQQQQQMNTYFQPRFPVILQRPPGLQAPVPPPCAPPHLPAAPAPPHLAGKMMGDGSHGNQMGMNRMSYYLPQPQNNQMPNGQQFGPNFQHMLSQGRLMAPPPGLAAARAGFVHGPPPYNQGYRPPTKMDQPPPMNNAFNQQMMPPPQMQQQQIQQQQQQQQLNKQQSPKTQNPKLNQPQNVQNQKNRIIYNSNQKNQNLTSQNLVQMIQNTHPMLQFNNMSQMSGFHNANHHPMLNRNGIHPSHQLMMQRQGFVNNNGNTNNNNNRHPPPASPPGPADEYAGLMSSREKQWLLNIQMLQLNTGTPYVDDFYYTVFLERQSRKEKEGVKEAHKANQQNHPFYSGHVKPEQTHRERHNSNRHNSQSEDVAPRTYVPTQFENSLGRLQCGSVTAPRKIIDVELVQGEAVEPARAPSRASTANHSEYPREIRRTKQILLDIEALYLILLRLEELNEPLAISNALILKEREEKQKLLDAAQKEMETLESESNVFLRNIEAVHRKAKTESPKADVVDKRQVVNLTVTQNPALTTKNLLDENKDELINKMFSGLLHEDRLQQLMMVRKGKALLARFLARVPGAHPRLRAAWSRALRCVAAAARRDDGALTPLAARYHEYLQCSAGWAAVTESCGFLAEALDPARTPYALTAPFTMSCICSLIEKVTTLINTPEATANERQWSRFLKTFAKALKNTNLKVARPVHPLSELKLVYHLKQLESRSTIEILPRGKTPIDLGLSKTEFTELMLRHLS